MKKTYVLWLQFNASFGREQKPGHLLTLFALEEKATGMLRFSETESSNPLAATDVKGFLTYLSKEI